MDAHSAEPARILVVDDDVRTSRLLARMLEDDGFQVELASDGALAIARLARQPLPDILVTDLRLPHADGMAVARFARSLTPKIPIFVVTSYPDLVPRLEQSPKLDAVVYTKPFDYAALSRQLRASVASALPDSAPPSPPPGPRPPPH